MRHGAELCAGLLGVSPHHRLQGRRRPCRGGKFWQKRRKMRPAAPGQNVGRLLVHRERPRGEHKTRAVEELDQRLGAPVAPGALRVAFWGALAMAVTAGAGALFGAVD